MTNQSVVVVGAGPVGLFTALILAQNGIKVTVIEADEGISRSPRAAVHVLPSNCHSFADIPIADSSLALTSNSPRLESSRRFSSMDVKASMDTLGEMDTIQQKSSQTSRLHHPIIPISAQP